MGASELAVLTQVKNMKVPRGRTLFPGVSTYGNGILVLALKGATTWVCPAGVTKVKITCVGAGGSGLVSANGSAAGGGGGGGVAIGYFDVVAGTTYNFVVGEGGVASSLAGTSNTVANGTAGGSTSWNSVMTATGGAAGTSTGGAGGTKTGSFTEGVDGGNGGATNAQGGSATGGGACCPIPIVAKAGNGGATTAQAISTGGGSPTTSCASNSLYGAGYFSALTTIAPVSIRVSTVPHNLDKDIYSYIFAPQSRVNEITFPTGTTSVNIFMSSAGNGITGVNHSTAPKVYQVPAPFHGSAGIDGIDVTGAYALASTGGIGAGGGGCSASTTSAGVSSSGAGGDGLLIIEY